MRTTTGMRRVVGRAGLAGALAGGLAVVALVAQAGLWPAPAAAQEEAAEAVMIAAAEWARERLPAGALRVDPHRTGEGVGEGVAQRIARSLGADLGTLEETRRCADVMDPSSCRLEVAALVAISPPRLDGDEARVRVYAWHRQSDPREPVAKVSWEVELRRSGSGWSVVRGG